VARPQLPSRSALARPTVEHGPTGARSRRARAGLVGATVTGLAAVLALTVGPGTAQAAPDVQTTKAATPQEATRLASEADQRLEAVTEQVNEAQTQLTAQQKSVVDAGKAVDAAHAQLAALDGQMRQVARSAFTGENMSRFNALMTSDSAESFLDQVSTLDAIAGHTDDVLTQVTRAARAAEKAKSDAEAAAAKAAKTVQSVQAKQADLKTQIADYQAQFDALSAAQQQQVVTEVAGPELAPPATVTATSDAAQKAVDTALAHVGEPYVWGAAGPHQFDCSGLTQYAYAAAGVTLPHSSLTQSTMGTPVARADLQPGDLVFFYSPVSHVGMYIGNGQMVHASTFGKPVVVTSVDMKGYVGARRFVG
jgi:peptidoglycan DL-endopeptidase CwlO